MEKASHPGNGGLPCSNCGKAGHIYSVCVGFCTLNPLFMNSFHKSLNNNWDLSAISAWFRPTHQSFGAIKNSVGEGKTVLPVFYIKRDRNNGLDRENFRTLPCH